MKKCILSVTLLYSLACMAPFDSRALTQSADSEPPKNDEKLCIFTINGVKANESHPMHDYFADLVPSSCRSGGRHFKNDVAKAHSSVEWFLANPSGTAQDIEDVIEGKKKDGTCDKVIVIGHSLGGVAAWFIENADCRLFLDPPDCREGRPATSSPANDDICDAHEGGLETHPGEIDFDPGDHDPWVENENDSDNDQDEYCDELEDSQESFYACLEQVGMGHCVPSNPDDCGGTRDARICDENELYYFMAGDQEYQSADLPSLCVDRYEPSL